MMSLSDLQDHAPNDAIFGTFVKISTDTHVLSLCDG